MVLRLPHRTPRLVVRHAHELGGLVQRPGLVDQHQQVEGAGAEQRLALLVEEDAVAGADARQRLEGVHALLAPPAAIVFAGARVCDRAGVVRSIGKRSRAHGPSIAVPRVEGTVVSRLTGERSEAAVGAAPSASGLGRQGPGAGGIEGGVGPHPAALRQHGDGHHSEAEQAEGRRDDQPAGGRGPDRRGPSALAPAGEPGGLHRRSRRPPTRCRAQ